jgi:hypothetical protein
MKLARLWLSIISLIVASTMAPPVRAEATAPGCVSAQQSWSRVRRWDDPQMLRDFAAEVPDGCDSLKAQVAAAIKRRTAAPSSPVAAAPPRPPKLAARNPPPEARPPAEAAPPPTVQIQARRPKPEPREPVPVETRKPPKAESRPVPVETRKPPKAEPRPVPVETRKPPKVQPRPVPVETRRPKLEPRPLQLAKARKPAEARAEPVEPRRAALDPPRRPVEARKDPVEAAAPPEEPRLASIGSRPPSRPSTDRQADDAAWATAEEEDTAAAYDDYRRAYPSGVHAAQANQQYEVLRPYQVTFCNFSSRRLSYARIVNESPNQLIVSGWHQLDDGKCNQFTTELDYFAVYATDQDGPLLDTMEGEDRLWSCLPAAGSDQFEIARCPQGSRKVGFKVFRPQFKDQRFELTGQGSDSGR